MTEHAGWLDKKGKDMLQGWKQRWCIFDGEGNLSYYDQKPDEGGELKGSIALSGCWEIPDRIGARSNRFDLKSGFGVLYAMAASTDAEKATWLSTLAAVLGPSLSLTTHPRGAVLLLDADIIVGIIDDEANADDQCCSDIVDPIPSDTEKAHFFLDQMGLGKLKINEQVVLAMESNSIFAANDVAGLSVADLREAGFPAIPAKQILQAAGAGSPREEEDARTEATQVQTEETAKADITTQAGPDAESDSDTQEEADVQAREYRSGRSESVVESLFIALVD
jgi:hypothetical protein